MSKFLLDIIVDVVFIVASSEDGIYDDVIMNQALQKDILIVDVYGRGYWLAFECQKRGYDVSVLDLTSLMGPWSIEDMEGPFGVFGSKKHTPSQINRLTNEGPLILSDRGYVIWLKTGPLELKGPLGSLQLQKSQISDIIVEYLRDHHSSSEILEFLPRIAHLSFKESWLAHFGHQISSSILMDNAKGITFGRPLPLMSSFYHRKLYKRKDKQNLLNLIYSFPSKKYTALHATKSLLEYVQYQKDKQIKARHVIWMLSSYETHFCFEDTANMLFPKGIMIPKWYWTRYRLSFEKSDILGYLPDHFVILEDIYLPWTHDNMIIVQKTADETMIDAWIRLPYAQRFEKDYIKNYGQCIKNSLQDRIPSCNLDIQDWPKELTESPHQMGPSVFTVYDFKERQRFKRASLENVIFEGPEVWTSLGWDGQFYSNKNTLLQLLERLD